MSYQMLLLKQKVCQPTDPLFCQAVTRNKVIFLGLSSEWVAYVRA